MGLTTKSIIMASQTTEVNQLWKPIAITGVITAEIVNLRTNPVLESANPIGAEHSPSCVEVASMLSACDVEVTFQTPIMIPQEQLAPRVETELGLTSKLTHVQIGFVTQSNDQETFQPTPQLYKILLPIYNNQTDTCRPLFDRFHSQSQVLFHHTVVLPGLEGRNWRVRVPVDSLRLKESFENFKITMENMKQKIATKIESRNNQQQNTTDDLIATPLPVVDDPAMEAWKNAPPGMKPIPVMVHISPEQATNPFPV